MIIAMADARVHEGSASKPGLVTRAGLGRSSCHKGGGGNGANEERHQSIDQSGSVRVGRESFAVLVRLACLTGKLIERHREIRGPSWRLSKPTTGRSRCVADAAVARIYDDVPIGERPSPSAPPATTLEDPEQPF
jgi:hypothetical protein